MTSSRATLLNVTLTLTLNQILWPQTPKKIQKHLNKYKYKYYSNIIWTCKQYMFIFELKDRCIPLSNMCLWDLCYCLALKIGWFYICLKEGEKLAK